MNNDNNLILLVLLIFVLGIAVIAAPQSQVSTTPIGPLWDLQRTQLGVGAGRGAALSADGSATTFAGWRQEESVDASLFLFDLDTRNLTPLWIGTPASRMASDPCFSPDGKRILFGVHGITTGYPSDIYSVSIDGQRLTKLTESLFYGDKPGNPADPNNKAYWVGDSYQRYYYSPRFAPDGSRILLWVHDVVGQLRDFAAIMKPDGSNLEILAEGQPVAWSADGKAVYYMHKGLLTRMELESRAMRSLPFPRLENGKLLGRMKGRDWFAFRLDDGHIGWYSFEAARPALEFLGQWSVPGFKMAGTEKLELKGFEWSNGNEVLLWYQGEETERFEVVRIFDPTHLSR